MNRTRVGPARGSDHAGSPDHSRSLNHGDWPGGSDALRARLAALLDRLEQGLVERRREVRLALLAALAGEHSLLIGPPGTAKSELARRLHLAFADARYFERLLTRFSVPEELFGPLSISALEQDRYERQTTGYLPQASIAFIDEVFKANSAILNALLTLLNERQFDNGTERVACPLISAIGATNDIPAGEVTEAFFDRFLVRLPVAPVSPDGFRDLLMLDDACRPALMTPALTPLTAEGRAAATPLTADDPVGAAPLTAADRTTVSAGAARVRLPPDMVELLGELRRHLEGGPVYVSDRRWMKIVALLRTAAATEGRTELCMWDLWLLPWCTAHDADGQARMQDWLRSRLGVRDALAPPRLARIVQAFEAQATLEHEADELDYGADGQLKFSAAIDQRAVDAKGAAQVARLSYRRRRRYGATHVAARLAQVDALAARVSGYVDELRAHHAGLAAYVARSLWVDAGFARDVGAHLAAVAQALLDLAARTAAARASFAALPRLEQDPGTLPEPIAHEALDG